MAPVSLDIGNFVMRVQWVLAMAHRKDGTDSPTADVSAMPDLSEDEKKQLLEVMQRAKEFEAQEEKYLMRQPLEGQLYKYTNVMKGFQYRWFVVDPESGSLGYYEKEEHRRQKPRGSVHLAGAVVSPSDEDSQTFTVNVANGEIYRLRAQDAKERQYWVDRLRATAEYQLQTLAQNAPPLSGQLRHHSFPPSGRPTTASSESLPSPSSTSSAPTSKMLPPCTPSDIVVARLHHPGTSSTSNVKVTSSHTSSQVTKAHKSGHHRHITMSPHTSDAFRGTKEMLAQVRHHQQSLSAYISDLPSSRSVDSITCLDKEMLLLKATSSATLNCLEECLSILKQQQLSLLQAPNESSDLANESLGIRDSVRDGECTGEMISPSESFVSLTSIDDTPEVVMVNHRDEVEDDDEYCDTGLDDVEDHKNVILQLLSQLKLGMDLTKVVLPTFILEKRSLLEMFADCMAHPDAFLRIPDCPSPESRMLAVLEWYLASFHAARKGSIAKKPYNPIIGETFHCSWVLPPDNTSAHHTPDTDTNDLTTGNGDNVGEGEMEEKGDSEDEERRRREEGRLLYYCAEQVSHHPPISAFYFESPNRQICMNGSIWTKSKFMGMSIGVTMIGKIQIKLLDHEEEYELTLPSAYARSILTVPWVELGDRITITCKKTGYSAAVAFHPKPFYGGKINKITSEVRNPGGEIVCKVVGEWNGALEYTYANGESTVVDTQTLKTIRKCVRPITAQSNFESRRLWQNVTENLKKGDIDTATQHKRFLEEHQRQAEKHRQAIGLSFPSKYFHKEGDNWLFNQPLKRAQTQPSV